MSIFLHNINIRSRIYKSFWRILIQDIRFINVIENNDLAIYDLSIFQRNINLITISQLEIYLLLIFLICQNYEKHWYQVSLFLILTFNLGIFHVIVDILFVIFLLQTETFFFFNKSHPMQIHCDLKFNFNVVVVAYRWAYTISQ